MRIPEGTIEEVRAAADITDVISGFVRLKKAGRAFTGLCPFHTEKTPSFHVNPDRGIFKCFGCGRGGNVFTFLMEMEKISFIEAVRELAERYSIPIAAETEKKPETTQNLDRLYQVMSAAGRFFHDTLSDERGKAGAEYFRKRRWTEQTQRRFGLGFAPDKWDALLTHATAAGFDTEVLELTGLVIRKESGSTYDRFRNRVMFPVFSVTKKVIGFGARALRPEDEPKYLNSPETPIYIKSKVLYGLSQAIPTIREKDSVILVEGYADTLSLHQAGIENAVASSGTSLTTDQVRVLTRYTKNVSFLYDADSAGFSAMLRGMDILLEQDCDVRIVRLPAGEDPDSYVQKFGKEKLEERLEESSSFVDFVAESHAKDGSLENPEHRAAAIRHIVGLIAKMNDGIRREIYIHHIAGKYGIYESVLYNEMEALLKRRKKSESAPPRIQSAATDAPPVDAVESVDRPLPKFERDFVSFFLKASPDVQREVLGFIHLEYFHDSRLQRLLHLLFEQYEHVGAIDVHALDAVVGDDIVLHRVIADLLILYEPENERWSEVQTVVRPNERVPLLDAYRRLVLRAVDQRLESIHAHMKDHTGDVNVAFRKNELDMLRAAIARTATFVQLAELEQQLAGSEGTEKMATL